MSDRSAVIGPREILAIRAERDPGLIMRIAALIAVDNTIPETFCAVCSPDGEMHITVVLGRAFSERVDYLATRIESTMVSVIEVRHEHRGA